MRAKGSLLLRFAVLCGIGAFTSIAVYGQFLEPPDTNLFGSGFVKTFDIRGGVIDNDHRGNKSVKAEGYEGVLLFRDGQQLRGRLVSVGKDEIVWKRPDVSEALHFRRTDVHRVYVALENGSEAPWLTPFMPNANAFFPGGRGGGRRIGGKSPRNGNLQATIKLSGNDWLRGGVTSADGQSFVLRLDNKGPSITLQRPEIEWLYFDSNTAHGGGFDGSMLNAEDWLAAAPSATLSDDGTLVIAGQNQWFGRLLPQPPLFEISMEIPADSEEGTRLWLQPTPPMPNSFTTGAVNVGFGPKQLSVQRFNNDMEQSNFPISDAGGNGAKGMVHYRLFYDSDKHRLVVFRNGRNVADWKPDTPQPGQEARISIRPALLTNLIRISFPNIVMSASMSAAANALQLPADSLFLAGVPELLATAFRSHFAAQYFIWDLRSRFPTINSISLTAGPANGDQSKSLLKLHRFQVGPWNGTVPQEGAVASAGDQLSSATLGSIVGKLEGITEKDVIFSQRHDPMAPGMLIRLPRESSARFDPVARLGLGAAGELSVASLEIRDGIAHLHTAFADDMELPAEALGAVSLPSLELHSPMKGDALVFKNGDELPGALISASHNAPLRWRLSGGQEVAIELKNVEGIRFATPAPPKTPAETAYVELRNGDCLRGGVLSFDENRLGFKEPLVGSLSVDRSRIWKLFPQTGQEIRDGADDPAGWVSAEVNAGPFLSVRPREGQPDPKTAWLYFDGCYLPRPTPRQNGQMEVMFLSSPVPRQRDGLFEVRVELTEAAGNLLNAIISIAGKLNENGSSSAISISFSGLEMYVNVMNATRGQTARQVAVGEKMAKLSTRLSFRIFVNSVLGTADVMVNGTLLARIGQQPDERAPGIDQTVQVGGLSYSGQPIVFSNLWIGPWNGELPREENAGHASTALANGDVTASVPSALKDGKYLMETEVGPLRLPTASVNAIAFGGESAQTHSSARLRLVDGSALRVTSFECQNGSIASRSELFGDFHLPLGSIAEIVFNPEPFRPPTELAPKKPAQATPASVDAASAKPGEAR